MAFIRTKLISGKRYYYLVENKREGRRVVQKVLKYIGKAENLLDEVLKEKQKNGR